MSAGDVLAVDVGATSIRLCRFNAAGEMVGARSRRSTPYPCPPEKIVKIVADRVAHSPVDKVGLGFPGEVDHGVVFDAANLTRLGGLDTPFDDEMSARWRQFPLQRRLHEATGCDVVVDNDAAMAALGCAHGRGVELVITLGTGCGLALVVDGALSPVRDVGHEMLKGSATYDDLLGERGRRDNESQWFVHVVSAVTALASEFAATSIHLAGGNARRLSPSSFGSWSDALTIERGDPALRGAWRACYP